MDISKRDFRKLSKESQGQLRLVAVNAVSRGISQREAAKIFGVTYQIVCEWVKRSRNSGNKSLIGDKRGRLFGEKRLLQQEEENKICNIIKDKFPDDFNINSSLWTRKSIRLLISQELNFDLPLSTIGEYLRRWGFSAQKPKKQAYEQQPEKIQEWLSNEYPKIEQKAKKENAEIHWGDESSIRSDCQVAKSYSKIGDTPTVKLKSGRFSVNMVSTVTNNGKLRFMIYEKNMNANLFRLFLYRLIKRSDKKIFLILDNMRVHHAEYINNWTEKHKDKIELFFLPPYAPQYNPDEYLNNDIKQKLSRKLMPKK